MFWPALMVSELLHVLVSEDGMRLFAWGDGVSSPLLWNPKGFPSSHSTFQKYLNENTAYCCHKNCVCNFGLFWIWAWDCGYYERIYSIVGWRNLTCSHKWWILFVLSIFMKFHFEPNCLSWWTTSISRPCYIHFSKHNYFILTLIVVNGYTFRGVF